MTQFGSGSGTPATTFTYDLTSTDESTVARSEVRLLIGDSFLDRGPRPDDRNFTDTEIDYFLAQEAGHVQRTAALALETLASEWAKEESKQQLGPASSEAKQSSAFAERASALRRAYGHTNPAAAPGATTGGFVSWAALFETETDL